MKTIDTHGTFEQAIEGASISTEPVIRRLKAIILEIYSEVVEVPWPKQKIIGYGVGPKKMSEHFCYLGLHSKHVNLGFYNGAVLPDPEKLLEGTGKKLRHIKIKDLEQAEMPAVREILLASLAERQQALGLLDD